MYTSFHLYLPADTSLRVNSDLFAEVLSRFEATNVWCLSQYAKVLPAGDATVAEPAAKFRDLTVDDALRQVREGRCACSHLMFRVSDTWWRWLNQGLDASIPPELRDTFYLGDFSLSVGESEFVDLFSDRVVNVPQVCVTFSGDGAPSDQRIYFERIQMVPAIRDIQEFVEDRTGVPWNLAISGYY